MKRLFILTALFLAATLCASAFQFIRTSEFELSPDQTLDEELWLFADTSATLQGYSEDDIFLATTSAELSGTFAGDLWAVGEQISFTGRAKDHARFAGRIIRVAGSIERNLAAAGTTIELDSGAVVKFDTMLVGENVLFKGETRNLRMVASKATISGRIHGNVRVAADDIVVIPGTEISGNLVYTSPSELVLDKRVTVGGELRRSFSMPGGFESKKPTLRQTISVQSFLYISALLSILAFSALFPQFTGRAVRTLRQSPGWCALAGLLAFGLMPMIGVVSMFTVIGFAVGGLTLGVYFALLYLAKGIVALVIGGILLRRRGPQPFRNVFTALSLGLVLVYLAVWIPYLGRTIWAVITILGLGALIVPLFSREAAPSAVGGPTNPPPLPQQGSATSWKNTTETREPDRKE